MGVEITSMQNPSVFLYGPGQAKVEDRPIPEISDGYDVIVQIAYVGVCGSDVHFWRHGGIGSKVDANHPLVMGHEASGVVHAIGDQVSTVAVGDHVAIEPGLPCRRCKACKNGKYNLCRAIRFAAAPPDSHGTLTRFFAISEDFVYKVNSNVSLQEAVLVEPLSVAVHATRQVDVKPGDNVVIMGSGTVGLLCGAVAKAFGAYRVITVDIEEAKLGFARDFIHCDTFLSKITDKPEETAARICETFGVPEGVDAVVEASGAESCMQAGIHVLRLGGSYVQTGVGKPMMQVPMLALSEKELKVHGCFRYGPGDYELAVKFVSNGSVNLKSMISSVTPFDQAIEAWEKTGRGEGIKNLIRGA